METIEDAKLITCILPQGNGVALIERLYREKGLNSANVSTGRGRGAGPVGSIGAWDEVDMVTVTVPTARADEIFDFVFHVGGLDQPRGGIMFQHAVSPATIFRLPEMDEEHSL